MIDNNVSLLTGWNAPVTGLEQIRHLDLVDGLLVVNRDLSRDTGCSAWVRSWPKPVVFALDYPANPHYERFAMVVHPLAKTVEAAVELLLDRIDEGKRDRRVIRVPYTWREGPSVASCPTAPSDNTDRSDVRTRIATPTLTYRDCFPRIERT